MPRTALTTAAPTTTAELIADRHALVAGYLQAHGLDAAFLFRPENVAWFCGDDFAREALAEDALFLMVTTDCRCLICRGDWVAHCFGGVIDGNGFLLKEFPWTRDLGAVVGQMIGDRPVWDDRLDPFPLPTPRSALTPLETQRLRRVAADLTGQLEAVCRDFRWGEPECAIAGRIAHRLLAAGLEPAGLAVVGDGRIGQAPRQRPIAAVVEHFAVLTATARRHGLHASLSRTVARVQPPELARRRHQAAVTVAGFLEHATVVGERVGGVFRQARGVYRQAGAEFAWTNVPVGWRTGYAPAEGFATPEDVGPVAAGSAWVWSVTIDGFVDRRTAVARSPDDLPAPPSGDWPTLTLEIDGRRLPQPAILVRP